MKYVPDSTGRFDRRPHYEQAELDELCERTIIQFMEERCGGMRLPIPTDVITKLIERDADDLDLCADLSAHGTKVEGFTDFCPNTKPTVKITEKLSRHKWQENRLRTTLTHEYGHVLLHAPLYNTDSPCTLQVLEPTYRSPSQIRGVSDDRDWMEWQAKYVSGAILMPVTAVKQAVLDYCRRWGTSSPISTKTGHAGDLTHAIAKAFAVSEDAAKIRLQQLGCFCA